MRGTTDRTACQGGPLALFRRFSLVSGGGGSFSRAVRTVDYPLSRIAVKGILAHGSTAGDLQEVEEK